MKQNFPEIIKLHVQWTLVFPILFHSCLFSFILPPPLPLLMLVMIHQINFTIY